MLLRAGNSVLQVSLYHISILLEVVTCYVLYKLSDLEFVIHFLLFVKRINSSIIQNGKGCC